MTIDLALATELAERAAQPDFPRLQAQLRATGYCAQPIRLKGHVETCGDDDRWRKVWSTLTEPDGVLRKACGNRREVICPACAERYRGDAYQLIAAGMRGGKGVPETVADHPMIFATLTAPSFGAVHTQRTGRDGRPLPFRPRRDAPTCPHGIKLACNKVHEDADACLGKPICLECFDHAGALLWNNLLGELWRRTTIYLPRKLARQLGITQKRLKKLVRAAYVKGHRRPAGGGLRRRVGRRRPGGRRVHLAALVRQGPAEKLRQDGAITAAHPAAGQGARRAPRAAPA